MSKATEAIRYMIAVWDEVQGSWRETPDHVQRKFLEAEAELKQMTNKSTNTTSDSGANNQPTVNEQLDKILGNLWDTAINIGSGSDWNRNKITEAKAKLQRLIVEARIDELKQVDVDSWGAQHIPEPRQYRDGYVIGVKSLEERIAQLEEELEK